MLPAPPLGPRRLMGTAASYPQGKIESRKLGLPQGSILTPPAHDRANAITSPLHLRRLHLPYDFPGLHIPP
jgi:hypothetical protein